MANIKSAEKRIRTSARKRVRNKARISRLRSAVKRFTQTASDKRADVVDEHPKGDSLDHAKHSRDVVIPAMNAVRAAGDTLETLVSSDLWPLPTYQEMLFIK